MFNRLLDTLQETVRRDAIDQPVIECYAQEQHVSNGHSFLCSIDYYGYWDDPANTENSTFRPVNDRRERIRVYTGWGTEG